MASTTRRRAARLTGVSAVTAALAMCAGPVTATTAPEVHGSLAADVPVGSAPPSPGPASPEPPSPPPSPPPGTPPGPSTPDTVPSAPPSQPPETPTRPGGTAPNPTDTSPSGEQSGPSGTGTSSAAARQQIEAADKVTADLSSLKEQVPEDLVPSVEQLTATVRATQDPTTPPQERDAVVHSAQAVSAALEVIGDPGTSPALRGQLTGLVKQVVATLGATSRPGLPPGERSTAAFVADHSASTLRAIGDDSTPGDLRNHLAGATSGAMAAVGGALGDSERSERSERSEHGTGARGAQVQQALDAARKVSVAASEAADPDTPDEGQKATAQSAHQAGATLARSQDPSASDEERKKAREEADQRIDRMEQKLEEALTAQGLPDVPLGKAAEVCTNAVFASAAEDTLGRNLGSLLPEKWNAEGVKDFWKSRDMGNDALDVLTQLRNAEYADALVKVERLVPGLAASVPADRIFGMLGRPALHCLKAARQLDHDLGVKSGSWVKKAEEV